ncbi:phage tail protein I [Novosphingobium guangzhouense]|uniref:Phage tail protein I n=2 Tax=Novosphingobium guangzhouense TaxID=1850347 RepID=A0A2K2G617_9SPHN|nr:phage tail protein I [Novosphingobium guangzhouense]
MLSRIDFSAIGTEWNPATCLPGVLPFLAWGLAISHWDSAWTLQEKRDAVANAMRFHKIKGTRAAVEEVLDRFHPLLTVVEGDGMVSPRPHTFEVHAPAIEIGADFLTPQTAAAIIRDVAAAKPLRSHFNFVQLLEVQATLFMAAGGMAGTMFREDYAVTHDTSRDWSKILQTDDGEPIRDEDGNFLEDE